MKNNQMTPKRKETLAQVLNKPKVAGYVFILPFIIGFLAFLAVPMILSLGFSFTRYNILKTPVFIGLENYRTMFFGDPKFWKVFGVTMYYVLFSVPLRLIMALAVAMLLVKSTKLSGFYRAVYYIPSLIGGSVAVALVWKQLFGSRGPVVTMIKALGVKGFRAGQRFFYSHKKARGRIVPALETAVTRSRYSFYRSLSHRSNPSTRSIFDNREGMEWANPFTGELSTLGFWDLYRQAFATAAKAVPRYLSPDCSTEEIRGMANNVDFRGKPLSS